MIVDNLIYTIGVSGKMHALNKKDGTKAWGHDLWGDLGGSFLNLSYLAAERTVPGYGGGMSSAKAALESDTRTLAYEVGRKWGHRVNSISAGPYASRAASAIVFGFGRECP